MSSDGCTEVVALVTSIDTLVFRYRVLVGITAEALYVPVERELVVFGVVCTMGVVAAL